MKAVKVQYTVRPEYREENKKNIQKVMDALKKNPIDGMQYSTYTDAENPDTFIHINMARNAEAIAQLTQMNVFKQFQMALKASQPLSPPQQTQLNLVGAAFDL